MGQLYGRPAETVISRGRLELFPSAGELGIFDACLVALRTRQRIEFEVPWFQENGITGAFRLSAAPFGEFLLVTARDITGEMLAEAALAESQRQYQLLAQSATDVTFRTARNANLEWVSPSVAAVLGLGPRMSWDAAPPTWSTRWTARP